MEQQSLSVEARNEKGKGASRRFRRAGRLPGILYGLGHSTPIVIDPKIVQKTLLEEGGRNRLFNLSGKGVDGKHALIKDYQLDPVNRALIHVDLLEIDVKKKIDVTVPINLVGKSAGVAEGGVLNFIEREVSIRCLPTAIPQHIDVDVTALKIGDSIHYNDIQFPEGIERATHLNSTLVTVVPPTKEEEAAPSLTPTAEPEVITAKKPAEGEEGAAAGAPAGEKKDEKKK